ncbi:MAG TPA: hypothetical protein VIJ34_15335 [Acidimicrobiales bacterium]
MSALAPPNVINLTTVALGRPTRSGVAAQHVEPGFSRWRRLAVVEYARRSNGGANPFLDHLDDF